MDHIKEIKEIVAEQVYEQLKHNLDKVDTKELGMAVDIVKDMSEAAYYCSVVEAMEEAEEEKKNGNTVYYTERYLPMYREMPMYRENPRDMGGNDMARYYDRGRSYYNGGSGGSSGSSGNSSGGNSSGNSGGSSYYGGDRYNMPYYDYQEPVARDLREGRSPRSRRKYMESKEQHQTKEVQLQELEKYMTELSQDMTEMIADATPEEKQMLHKKLSTLTNKIELLSKS